MSNPLFLLVGRSASGKTTIANMLEKKYGHKQVQSYTTRPPRYDGEVGHIFVSEEDFKNLDELAAYTFYNGHHYGTTVKQLDECDIYVIDVPGIETLLKKYTERPICIIYFDTSVPTRIDRMVDRGDGDHAILGRLMQDEQYDWQHKLDSLVWHYTKIENKSIELYRVDANKNQTDVLEQVLYYMRKCNGDDYE